MKKRLLTAIAFSMVAICSMSQTDDKVFIDDFNMESEGQLDITVNLDNPANVFCALQFDLYLPDGVSIALKETGELYASLNKQRIKSDHSMSVKRIKNDHYRFVCFSTTNNAFNGQEGPIVDLKVEADSSLLEGETVTGSIENIIITKTNGQDFKPRKTIFNISVMPETGIDILKATGGELQVYDLNGNRIYDVKNLKTGFYIINGRKIFISNKNSQKR